MKPLMIDLFSGLGGWAEGGLAEGWDVIGFDIEQHVYGEHRYPAQLVIQDVRTLHGSQFKGASLIVASPPCQAYSYRAMPWKKAKALPPPDNTLFETCFRIQREACEAAGHHIPLIVENVRGAQKWVGRARWNYGSFYLWGDVPALMPITLTRRMKFPADCGPRMWKDREYARLDDGNASAFHHEGKTVKVPGLNWSAHGKPGYKPQGFNVVAAQRYREGIKGVPHRPTGHWTNPAENGIKCGGDWFNAEQPSISRLTSSKSNSRKAASAMIAKIPLPLSRYIGRTFAQMRSAS